jgi:hypothetical protein
MVSHKQFGLMSGCLHDEERLHFPLCRSTMHDALGASLFKDMAADGVADRAAVLSRCRCQMQLSESEALLRQLREQQRNAKEHHAYGLTQIDMMSDLISLLQLKQQLQASYAQQCGQMGSSGGRQLGSAGSMMPGGAGARGIGGQSYNTNVMVL